MMLQSLVEGFLTFEIKTGMLEHPFICMICHQDMEDEYTSVLCVNAECQFLLNLLKLVLPGFEYLWSKSIIGRPNETCFT